MKRTGLRLTIWVIGLCFAIALFASLNHRSSVEETGTNPGTEPGTGARTESGTETNEADRSVVTVDLKAEEHVLPLYGFNISYNSNAQGIVDDEGHFDPQKVEMLKEIRPQWLRFPGGAESDTYDWKRAIGPQNTRTSNVFGQKGKMWPVSNVWGPDEAARYMEVVGGTLVMVAPFNKTAQDAADWVEYMNAPNDGNHPWAAKRAANGHPEPYGIKYWEIGNESAATRIFTWTSWPFNGDDIDHDGVPQNSKQTTDWWAYGGVKSFTNQKAVRWDSWADTDILTKGEASETYYVKFPPVVPSSISLKVGKSLQEAEDWSQVQNFNDSGATSKHYVFDPVSGKIEFGDNIHGKIPEKGLFVYLNYTSGPHDGFEQFYDRMKKVDPSIEVISSYFGLHDAHKEAPDRIRFDGYQVHDGSWLNDKAVKEGPLDGDSFFDAIGRAYTFRDKINNVVKQQLDPNGEDNVKLSISEQAYGQYIADGSRTNQPSYTIAGALMQALIMAHASLSDRVELIGPNYLVHRDVNPYKAFVTDDGLILAQARSVQMFTTHFGKYLLKTEASNVPAQPVKYWPTQNAKKPAVVEVPQIVALSSMSADRKTAYVMLINTTKSESRTVDIEIKNLTSPTRSKSWVLDASSLTARNTKENPDAVGIRIGQEPIFHGNKTSYTSKPASVTVIEVQVSS